MNAQGGDIYLRPLDGPELLLVDALDAEAVEDMRRHGLAPAMTVESNPGRFQAWVKLSYRPLSRVLREHALSDFSRTFPEVSHYGRLAGFTNQQLEPNPTGQQPFVLAAGATGKVGPAAASYFAAIEQHVRELKAEKRRLIDAKKAQKAPRHDRGRSG
jgi:hypothetical protein